MTPVLQTALTALLHGRANPFILRLSDLESLNSCHHYLQLESSLDQGYTLKLGYRTAPPIRVPRAIVKPYREFVFNEKSEGAVRVDFSPLSKSFLAAMLPNKFCFWNIHGVQQNFITIPIPDEHRITDFKCDSSNLYLIIGASDGSLKMYSMTGKKHWENATRGNLPIKSLDVTTLDIAAVIGDQFIDRWYTWSGTKAETIPDAGNQSCCYVLFDPTNTHHLIVAHRDGSLLRYDSYEKKVVCTYGYQHIESNTAIAISPNGKIIAKAAGLNIRLFSTEFPNLVLEGHLKAVRSLDFSPCSRYLLSVSHDQTARIWDATDCGSRRGFQTSLGMIHLGSESCGNGKFVMDCSRVITGSKAGMTLWEIGELFK